MTATSATDTEPTGASPAAPGPGRWAAAGSGLVAVGVAVAVAELLAAVGGWFGWFGAAAAPLTSLANGFIVLTPEWLKQLAISAFGVHDKDALRVGMGLVLVLLAVTVGLLWRHLRWAAAALLAVLTAVVVLAVLTRAGAGPADLLPTLIGVAAGAFVLHRLLRPTLWQQEDPGPDRRRFLRLLGITAATAGIAGVLSRLVPNAAAVQASRAAVRLPAPVAPLPGSAMTGSRPPVATPQAIPADADLGVDGIAQYLTPNEEFYLIDTTITPPLLRAEDWKLHIHGMVEREITIDFADLQSRPQINRAITLTCVSNSVGGDLVGNATWTGTRLDAVLAQAGPLPGADCVLSTSIDGFTCSTPIEALTDGRDALLAIGMNGEPLPIKHGFPVRMVVPGLYGFVSATKWVVDLEVTRFDQVEAYWTVRGWSPRGPIKTASRIDVPRSTAKFPQGQAMTFGGVAWAQHRGITEVQLQIDDGPWLRAELGGAVSTDTWRQWKFDWIAAGVGAHRVRCRAVDGTGQQQTGAEAGVIPDGATGWDSVIFEVTAA